jgi:hypothetical protein
VHTDGSCLRINDDVAQGLRRSSNATRIANNSRGLGDYGRWSDWQSRRPAGAPDGATWDLAVYSMEGQLGIDRPARTYNQNDWQNREYYNLLPHDPMTRGHPSNQWGNSNFRYDPEGNPWSDEERSRAGIRYPSPGRGTIPEGAYRRGCRVMSEDIIECPRSGFMDTQSFRTAPPDR